MLIYQLVAKERYGSCHYPALIAVAPLLVTCPSENYVTVMVVNEWRCMKTRTAFICVVQK